MTNSFSVDHFKALLEFGLYLESEINENPQPEKSIENDLVFGYMAGRADTLVDLRERYFAIVEKNKIQSAVEDPIKNELIEQLRLFIEYEWSKAIPQNLNPGDEFQPGTLETIALLNRLRWRLNELEGLKYD